MISAQVFAHYGCPTYTMCVIKLRK